MRKLHPLALTVFAAVFLLGCVLFYGLLTSLLSGQNQSNHVTATAVTTLATTATEAVSDTTATVEESGNTATVTETEAITAPTETSYNGDGRRNGGTLNAMWTTDGDALQPLESEVVIEPFPFMIYGRLTQVTKSSDAAPEPNYTTWTFTVTNTTDTAQTLSEIRLYGYLKAWHFSYQGVESEIGMGDNPTAIVVNQTIAPGETFNLELQVTTYLGGSTHGIMQFCVPGEKVEQNCFSVPVAVTAKGG